jgi:hypothetical protein
VKSGSTANTTAGGLLDGVTVTILNADKRIGTHMFVTVARNDAGQVSNLGSADQESDVTRLFQWLSCKSDGTKI